MNVLVDTSVWVQHFRRGEAGLIRLLENDQALTHPMVVAELACGVPPEPRAQTLSSLQQLQECTQAGLDEVIAFIEREKLFGRGCGLVDFCLLASTLITTGARLWTLDRRLAGLATHFEIGYSDG